ncbi:MAG: hypothetical protein ACK5DM_25735, partial [Planctomyces sp.]
GTGGPPLPSISWPLRTTRVPLWVFMSELAGGGWGAGLQAAERPADAGLEAYSAVAAGRKPPR